ncbi:hypothetical protein ACNKHS_01260 [Shigella flexneri]
MEGIPAALVAKFLDERGAWWMSTGPYSISSCSASGWIKPAAMGLLRGLMEFESAHTI